MTHDLEDGGSVVPVVRSDGTVQVLSVLNSKNDATSFSYDFSSAQGASVSVLADGSALIVDDAGDELATIQTPWAMDASGTAVPTRFTAEGAILTQIVEPSSAAMYPIVADPAITVTTYQYKAVNVVKTSNWTNKSKQLGVCNVLKGAAGGTCTISVTKSVTTTVGVDFGLTTAAVAAKIGISSSKRQ